MNARERFQAAAERAQEKLDDKTLELLAFTIETHVRYKETLGYSTAEWLKWEAEVEQEG